MPSSVIRSVSYDPAGRALTVRFVSGRVYVYADVPARVVAGLRKADSKGRYFNAHIRNAYRCRALPADA